MVVAAPSQTTCSDLDTGLSIYATTVTVTLRSRWSMLLVLAVEIGRNALVMNVSV